MRSFLVALAFALSFAPRAHAQQLADLLPREAPIRPSAEGFVRLPLPGDVVSQVRPDLSDLRVFDAAGGEVAYLVDRGDRPYPVDAPPVRLPLPPMAVSRTRERVDGLLRYRESFTVAPIGGFPPAPIAIAIETTRPDFVAAVRVTGTLPDGTETVIATGSYFRLGTPARERLELPLDAIDPSIHNATVTLETEDGYLEPSLVLVQSTRRDRIERVSLPLTVRERRSEAGRTIITCERPPGVAPERIAIVTTTASFVRSVAIATADAHRGMRDLGAGTVLRVEGIAHAEELAVPISSDFGTGGSTIEIAIDDGDSPPLEGLALFAEVRQPALVFEGRRASVLRFGGGRVRAPRYDLQALFGTTLGEAMIDRISGPAELGAAIDNPTFDATPTLAFAMREGAAQDVTRSSHRARLVVPRAREGLSVFTLPADVLAHLHEDLADLRVVAENDNQWPYLLVPSAQPLTVPLTVGAIEPDPEPGWHRRTLTLPVARVAATAILIRSSTALVVRDAEVRTIDADGEEGILGSASWQRAPEQRDSALQIPLSGARAEHFILRVRDGEEQALDVSGADALVPTSDVYVTATPGTYWVLSGDEYATPPSYDMAGVRAWILAVDAAPATLEPSEPNPRYREPGMLDRLSGDTILVWVVLLLAVLVLAVLTFRVARAPIEPSSGPPSEGEPPSEGGDDEPPQAPSEPETASDSPLPEGGG